MRVPKDQFKKEKEPKKSVQKHCTTEPINVKKINLFDDKKDNYYKENPNEKKMYKDPVPRSRPSPLVEIQCSKCRDLFRINKMFLKEGKYTCDDCVVDR